ncbi:MAG TPA: hypothetical protein VKS25_14525 [Solirubrobacteraceae bacterium]|nr:hypothetical protein [Solirubrobacteraceae bacterium]
MDRVALEEAEDDAIWMRIDVVESEVAGCERPVDAALGHREFALPEAVVLEHRVVRANAE